MRITKNQLRQIIKEELAAVLSEDKPAKGSPEYLALTGANVAGRAARKVKRAFAGSGEEERSAEEQPEGPPLPSHKTVPLDTINDLVDQPPGSKARRIGPPYPV